MIYSKSSKNILFSLVIAFLFAEPSVHSMDFNKQHMPVLGALLSGVLLGGLAVQMYHVISRPKATEAKKQNETSVVRGDGSSKGSVLPQTISATTRSELDLNTIGYDLWASLVKKHLGPNASVVFYMGYSEVSDDVPLEKKLAYAEFAFDPANKVISYPSERRSEHRTYKLIAKDAATFTIQSTKNDAEIVFNVLQNEAMWARKPGMKTKKDGLVPLRTYVSKGDQTLGDWARKLYNTL